MRFIFLIPDFDPSSAWEVFSNLVDQSRLRPLQKWVKLRLLRTDEVFGGTLNIIRHCSVARSCGVDAVLATISGRDTYGDKGLYTLPFIRWADRTPNDICLVPDFVTEWIDEIKGPAIAYQQVPIHAHNNFNYKDDRVAIWTDSPLMKGICETTFPGKDIEIVPNIVDNELFPFVPQVDREPGLLFAFPRKGPEFIEATQKHYTDKGGTYWKFELIDGLSIRELAKQFRRPQVFLASAPIEGCALPPQESMASGIVVVGRTAQGANFCMEHRETAMTAETPEEAAQCLLELEDAELRDKLSHNAHNYIRRYFPSGEPSQFWQQKIRYYETVLQSSGLNVSGDAPDFA